jgi:hypothetical protein
MCYALLLEKAERQDASELSLTAPSANAGYTLIHPCQAPLQLCLPAFSELRSKENQALGIPG